VSHLRAPDGTVLCEHDGHHEPEQPALRLVEHEHDEHEHSHGLVDRSILRSHAGIRAVSWSLATLTVTALVQSFIYARTLSVALLADLIRFFLRPNLHVLQCALGMEPFMEPSGRKRASWRAASPVSSAAERRGRRFIAGAGFEQTSATGYRFVEIHALG